MLEVSSLPRASPDVPVLGFLQCWAVTPEPQAATPGCKNCNKVLESRFSKWFLELLSVQGNRV